MVLGAGIEPAHPEGYRILSPVRLPIPPPKHLEKISTGAVYETNGETAMTNGETAMTNRKIIAILCSPALLWQRGEIWNNTPGFCGLFWAWF